jgi:hypothetical protein
MPGLRSKSVGFDTLAGHGIGARLRPVRFHFRNLADGRSTQVEGGTTSVSGRPGEAPGTVAPTQTSAGAGNAALSSTLLRTMQRAMGKWGVNPSDLVHVVSISAHFDLLADTNLLADKFGPQATILTGQIGSIGGVPVVVSEHQREDLNASGVYDGITTNRATSITVNRGEWAIGQRMALDVEVDDSIYREQFQRVVVAFAREDPQHIGDAAANDDTALTFNVAVT